MVIKIANYKDVINKHKKRQKNDEFHPQTESEKLEYTLAKSVNRSISEDKKELLFEFLLDLNNKGEILIEVRGCSIDVLYKNPEAKKSVLDFANKLGVIETPAFNRENESGIEIIDNLNFDIERFKEIKKKGEKSNENKRN